MLLTELTGIKNIKSLTPKQLVDYIDKLEGTSLKKLGDGANGAAYTDGKVAFKFWHRDSAYTKFINYALANQDNPAIPKLYSKIRHLPFAIETHGPGGTLTGLDYIKMELLSPLPTTSIRILSDKGLAALGLEKNQDKVDITQMYEALSRKSIESTLTTLVKEIFKRRRREYKDSMLGVNPFDNDALFSLFNPSFVDFVRTVKEIHKLMGKFDYDDLHYGNLAYRKSTGDIVILDPLANVRDLEINSELWNS